MNRCKPTVRGKLGLCGLALILPLAGCAHVTASKVELASMVASEVATAAHCRAGKSDKLSLSLLREAQDARLRAGGAPEILDKIRALRALTDQACAKRSRLPSSAQKKLEP